jgi:hypothetical protein
VHGVALPLGPGFALGLAHPIIQPFFLNSMAAVFLIPVLYVTGLAAFWLFYKSVDFFDNI